MNDVIEAINSRRSVRKMRPDPPVTKEQVETIIEAAIWAPNHYLTEPWRFVVLTGDARRKLGDAMSTALMNTSTDRPTQERLDIETNRPLSASVIIALISSPKVGNNIVLQEEMVAAGAALQNMLLAAHSLGLGAMVRTGSHAYSEAIRKFFEMREGEGLVGLVYLGQIAEPPPPRKRRGTAEKVIWRGL
jgi:nitroreductase